MPYVRNWETLVLEWLGPIARDYLQKNHPDTLLTKEEIGRLNKGIKIQITINKQIVRNPEWRTNRFGDDEEKICRAIAKAAWNDGAFQDSLEASSYIFEDDFGPEDITEMMLGKSPGQESSRRFAKFVSNVLRKTKTKKDAKVQAAENLKANLGPFEKMCEDDIDAASKIIGEFIREGEVEGLSRSDAESVIVHVLEQHGLEYVWFLSIPQLRAIVETYVREENPHRPRHVQNLIDEYHQDDSSSSPSSSSSSSSSSSDFGSDVIHQQQPDADRDDRPSHGHLHAQEKNEVVAMLDPLIKLKATCNLTVKLLMEGKAIDQALFDRELDFDDLAADVYVLIPEEFRHEICQGAAKRFFDDYKSFEGDKKKMEGRRYLVGIFTARIFDCNANQAAHVNQDGENAGGYGIPIAIGKNGGNIQIMREIAYSPGAKGDPGRLNVTVKADSIDDSHTFQLHRLIGIIISAYGLNIFGVGDLAELGIEIKDGNTYEQHFAYRPLSSDDDARAIARALRIGDAHSRQCDIDHWAGRDRRHRHGCLYCGSTSHRMNICLSWARRYAGHWCFGLQVCPYKGGIKSTKVVATTLPDGIVFPSAAEVANGAVFDGSNLEEIDPLRELDPIKPEDIGLGDVDCKCKELPRGTPRGTKCACCMEKEEAKSGAVKKRRGRTTSVAAGKENESIEMEKSATRGGRLRKKVD